MQPFSSPTEVPKKNYSTFIFTAVANQKNAQEEFFPNALPLNDLLSADWKHLDGRSKISLTLPDKTALVHALGDQVMTIKSNLNEAIVTINIGDSGAVFNIKGNSIGAIRNLFQHLVDNKIFNASVMNDQRLFPS